MKTILISIIAAVFLAAAHAGEHDHHMKGLVDTGDVTHTATTNGSWSNAGTWDAGIPGDDAYVLIPDGVSVTYDANDATRQTPCASSDTDAYGN